MASPTDDTYYVNDPSIEIDEDVGGGVDTVITTVSYTLRAGEEIEVLRSGNRTASLRLTGNEFDNVIYGNVGNNVLDGGGGDDAMIGSGGDDTYRVDSAGDLVFEISSVGSASQGFDSVLSSVNYVLAAGQSIEVLQAGNRTRSIQLVGNELGQTLIGNQGNNVLDGGGGADTMQGGAGNDVYYVDFSSSGRRDLVVEGAANGIDSVYSKLDFYTLTENVENLYLTGSTHSGHGNSLANSIVGNADRNSLDGLGGADTLDGRGGDDTYYVDNAGDTIIEAAGGGSDTVNTAVDYQLTAGQQIETLVGTSGSGAASLRLTGNEFGQSITGASGADVIDGREGSDMLRGQGGADVFAFSTAVGAGQDTILDFDLVDKFQLSRSVFSTLELGRLSFAAFKEISTGTAVDADDRIIYNKATGALAYDADGSGSAFAAVTFATVSINKALVTYDDFTIV
jgi:Ca2+-binding RTX toxin-like protein